jgi:metallopeptidase MepB
MLENWCWIPDILRSISTHYSSISLEYANAWKADNPSLPLPPKQLPLELAEKLAATRNLNLASVTQRQLYLSKFDRQIHGASSKEEVQLMDFANLYNDIRKEISGLCGPEDEGAGCDWGIGHTRFQHMFNGYDGGYYAYSL